MAPIDFLSYSSLDDFLKGEFKISKDNVLEYLNSKNYQSGGMPGREHSTGVHYYQSAPNRRRPAAGQQAQQNAPPDTNSAKLCILISGVLLIVSWLLFKTGEEAVAIGNLDGGGKSKNIPDSLRKEVIELLPKIKNLLGKDTVNSHISYWINEYITNGENAVDQDTINCQVAVLLSEVANRKIGVDYYDMVVHGKNKERIHNEFIFKRMSSSKSSSKSKTRKNRK